MVTDRKNETRHRLDATQCSRHTETIKDDTPRQRHNQTTQINAGIILNGLMLLPGRSRERETVEAGFEADVILIGNIYAK